MFTVFAFFSLESVIALASFQINASLICVNIQGSGWVKKHAIEIKYLINIRNEWIIRPTIFLENKFEEVPFFGMKNYTDIWGGKSVLHFLFRLRNHHYTRKSPIRCFSLVFAEFKRIKSNLTLTII